MNEKEVAWLDQFVRAVTEVFPGRVACIGLQGSRGREEARPDSDIDMVVILDRLEYGDLEFLRPCFGREDAARAVRTGLCALYHSCVHNALHERDPALLAGLFKMALFTLKAKRYCETGQYVKGHRELAERLAGEEREVARRALALCGGETPDLDRDSELLFGWCGSQLRVWTVD